MRWDALFADLEAQAAAWERTERASEVAERTRIEAGGIGLADRICASALSTLRFRCTGQLSITGLVRQVGPDWLLVDEGSGREAVLIVDHVLSAVGLNRYAQPGGSGTVSGRLGVRHALRGVVRDRSAVRVHLSDGAVLAGTLDRVGADWVELAVHPVGEARRRSEVRETATVRIHAIVAVRRASQ